MASKSKYPISDSSTIEYYERNAYMFVTDTVGVSMGETLGAFLALVPKGGHILDWGCGSGRDSLAMTRLGFRVTSTDASESMCKATESLLGDVSDIRNETFTELSETDEYDGIWACASLLHTKPNELPEVLCTAWESLIDGGVLYCSFKQGEGCGYHHGRWFTNMDKSKLQALLSSASFDIERIWVTEDIRHDRTGEMWVNALARKRVAKHSATDGTTKSAVCYK